MNLEKPKEKPKNIEKPKEKDDLSKILRYIIGCLSYIIGIKVPKDIEKALNNIERRNK